ncbi:MULTISPECIES: hypothetical protein [Streptomyces violaceusniger group]|nr:MULTISPECIES: hypothetical protein [Streptomyces violaceusniger group]
MMQRPHISTTDTRPGTTDDLVADAHAAGFTRVSSRSVRDWTEFGLLAQPAFRKSSQHGSDHRVYPPEQRELFLRLLWVRERLPQGWRYRRVVLARTIVGLWLLGLLDLPTEQVRRALRNTLGMQSTAAENCKIASALVNGLAHPSASTAQIRKARLVVAQCLGKGCWDRARVLSVLVEVSFSWSAHADRATGSTAGDDTPNLGQVLNDFAGYIDSRNEVMTRLREEAVTPAQLLEARRRFNSDPRQVARRLDWIMEAMVHHTAGLPGSPDNTAAGSSLTLLNAFMHELIAILGLG